MDNRTARGIFWTGTLVSLVLFLALTADTHARLEERTHAGLIDAQVIAGKRSFERHNCNDCHTILGFGAYYAPDLTRAASRIGEAGIRRRLMQPEVAFAASFRKMPHQNISAAEAADLIAYLRWVEQIDNHDWPPQDSRARRAGRERAAQAAVTSPAVALIETQGCLDCHLLGERGKAVGPRLEWAGARYRADWIARYLADPGGLAPGSEMPAFDQLSAGDRAVIADYLVALGSGAEGR